MDWEEECHKVKNQCHSDEQSNFYNQVPVHLKNLRYLDEENLRTQTTNLYGDLNQQPDTFLPLSPIATAKFAVMNVFPLPGLIEVCMIIR